MIEVTMAMITLKTNKSEGDDESKDGDDLDVNKQK